MGVSENRGPQYSTLNSRILIVRTPKIRYPVFSEFSHVLKVKRNRPEMCRSFDQAVTLSVEAPKP